jgi:hypothetical protein
VGGSYYTLSYEPLAAPAKDAFVHIRVECSYPGSHVETRTGYYPGTEFSRGAAKATGLDTLTRALLSTERWNGLSVTADAKNSASGITQS